MYRHRTDADRTDADRTDTNRTDTDRAGPAAAPELGRPGPAPVAAATAVAGRSPAMVMALQRSVGNRAVTGTLQRHATGSAVAVQRHATGSAVAVQRDESVPDWEHGLLTDLHQGARVLGPSVRSSAASMPKVAARYTAGKTELDNIIDFLKMHEDRSSGPSMGDQAVAAVAATGSAAKALPSASKKDLKAEILAYDTSKPELRGAITMISSQQAQVKSAAQTLLNEGQKKDLLVKNREKAKAEADLADVQEKRKDAIEKMTMFLDFATMLADPAKGWTSALDKATGMIGGSLKDMVFAGTMAAEIAAAKDKVAALTRSVLGLEDSIALTAISAAAAKLEAEQVKLQAMLETLVSSVVKAEAAQHDLHDAMAGLGAKGAAAASALDEGTNVLDMGNDAIRKLPAVQSLLDATTDTAGRWLAQVDEYLDALTLGNDGLDANQRSWAHDAALAHRKQAVDWTAWVKAEAAKLAAGQGYLEKGSFRERYTKGVEDALMGVRNKL